MDVSQIIHIAWTCSDLIYSVYPSHSFHNDMDGGIASCQRYTSAYERENGNEEIQTSQLTMEQNG